MAAISTFRPWGREGACCEPEPKIELHLHLEGAASPSFVRGLAAEKKADISGIFDAQGHYKYADFNAFLNVYEVATSVINTPQDYARLTTAVLEECAAHGVIYAETFLSPDFCGGGDVGAWREYVAAMQEAALALRDTIELRAIVTCIRHFGPEKAGPGPVRRRNRGRFRHRVWHCPMKRRWSPAIMPGLLIAPARPVC